MQVRLPALMLRVEADAVRADASHTPHTPAHPPSHTYVQLRLPALMLQVEADAVRADASHTPPTPAHPLSHTCMQ
eukprot:78497-Chlamydomonas_euryale.AAC.3